jgi:hypothetical protein
MKIAHDVEEPILRHEQVEAACRKRAHLLCRPMRCDALANGHQPARQKHCNHTKHLVRHGLGYNRKTAAYFSDIFNLHPVPPLLRSNLPCPKRDRLHVVAVALHGNLAPKFWRHEVKQKCQRVICHRHHTVAWSERTIVYTNVRGIRSKLRRIYKSCTNEHNR